jgi:H+/Cl- antiporter ClcA
MIRTVFLSALVITTALASGCSSSKKAPRVKESSAIASEVEEGFRQRWIDQRAAQLVAQGTAAEAARAQAANEFRERYDFSRTGRK